VYREPVRTRLALLILLAGCRSEPVVESKPAPRAEPKPAPSVAEDPDASRKRDCLAATRPDADPRYHGLSRSLCAEWIDRDVPGVSLAIVEPGKPTFTLALGQRCFGEDVV
jgi:hypothetical protein